MWFNYHRDILKIPRVTVPRIVWPLKLPRHSETVLSTREYHDLRNLIAIHKVTIAGEVRYIYVHRVT